MVESHYHIVMNAQKNNPRSVNQHIWIIKFFTKCLKGLSKTPNSEVSLRGHIFKCFFPISEHWPFFFVCFLTKCLLQLREFDITFLVKFLKNKLYIRTNMVNIFQENFKVSIRSWFSNHKSIISRSLGYK